MKKPRVTLLLIAINVLVFAWMAVHQQNIWFNRNQDFLYMLDTGANFNPFTVSGEYWRLFTSMVLHWGILHLAVNMYALYGIGRLLEEFLGPWRLILFYLITGLTAGISSLLFNVYVVSAGASGAIFGLYGYLIMQQVLANFSNGKALRGIAINFVLFVIVNYAVASQVNVDTAGHLGGFFGGVALCLLNFSGLLIPVWQQAMVLVILPFLVVFVPKDQLHYYRAFNRVTKADAHLRSVYGQLLTDDQRADSLRNGVLPELDSALAGLNGLVRVPAEIVSDTMVLRQYASLRKEEVNYRLLGIEKESYVYLDSIEHIAAILDSLPPLQYPLNHEGRQDPDDDELSGSATEVPALIKVFYDSNWREIPGQEGAHFFRLGRRDSLDRWQGDVHDYYLEGAIQMKGRYLNNMHDGVFRYYSREGKYESLGRYEKERPVGKWENYHANGLLESEVYYGNGSFTRSVYDSLGNPQVMNGDGKYTSWHSNGAIREEGHYVEGRKDGNWYGYYSSGKGHYQEFYRDGLLVRGVALAEDGERFVYDQLSVFPFPEAGMPAYKEYLVANLIRPENSKMHQGVVELSFLVDTDGSLRDFVVMQSLCSACDEEAIRLVREGPPWRPGVLRGHIKTPSNGRVEVYF